MTSVSRNDIDQLKAAEGPNAISIYLPTFQAGAETRQNHIRMKNLLQEAQRQLEACGFSESESHKAMAPARALVEDLAFWREQDTALSVFIRDGRQWVFKLPVEVNEFVAVCDRFHLRPLLQIVEETAEAFVLAISQKSVRLFHATRFDIEQLKLPDETPASIETLAAFDDTERHVEFHTGSPDHGPGNDRPAQYHGQGVGTDKAEEKKLVVEFARMVDDGVRTALRTQRAPLVLAAAESMADIYRGVTKYEPLHEEVLLGNPDLLRPEDLLERVRPLLTDIVEAARRRDAERFQKAAASRMAADELPMVLDAARNSQIETLFVRANDHAWGRYDPAAGDIETHDVQQPGDADLLEAAAIGTYLHGGTVHNVAPEAMPADSPVAATLRFTM
ncbi:MAG: hypothetical protein KGY81_08755 [Phycisphaerae bacterium]|nr:hypothetical protein [Phycisphaerae bacterium]